MLPAGHQPERTAPTRTPAHEAETLQIDDRLPIGVVGEPTRASKRDMPAAATPVRQDPQDKLRVGGQGQRTGTKRASGRHPASLSRTAVAGEALGQRGNHSASDPRQPPAATSCPSYPATPAGTGLLIAHHFNPGARLRALAAA